MSNKVIISSDSTCDLSPELVERFDIKILPLGVTLGTNVFKDGVDINPDMIYAHHEKTGELPKTTAANVGETQEFFEDLLTDDEAIIHFTISSEMSSTYRNACIAAEDMEKEIYVIDSRNLSTGSGLLVLAAAEMAQGGMPAKEIAEKLGELVKCVDASFVIDNLEYLHKGGRCSAVAMLGANLLKLKPCIEVKNGAMGVGKKYRGKFSEVLKQYVAERLQNPDDIDTHRVFVTHAGCDEEIANMVADLVKETLKFDEVLITRAGCTVSAHCGADTLGVIFIRKSPIA